MKMRFRKGNRIPYGQDHAFHRGLPAGVEFDAARLTPTIVRLVAPGYGKLYGSADGSDYGNGALFARGRWINRRFDAAEAQP